MGIASFVRIRRRALGLSQRDLCRLSGVTSIAMLEAGHIACPSYPTLQAIAKALDVTVSDLFAEPQQKRARRRTAKGV